MEELPENIGCPRFLDWEDFRDEFKKEFTPAHADSLAVNRLESSAYYQKSRPLDDYIDEFQDLITESGYTDPKNRCGQVPSWAQSPNPKRCCNHGIRTAV